VLEERIAALEGGVGAIAGGQRPGALHLAMATLMGAGSPHRRQQRAVWRLAQPAGLHPARFGITTTFVAGRRRRLARRHPARNPAAVRRDPGQPGPGRAGHPHRQRHRARHGLPLLVDSTFTTPWLMKPFDHGADLVYHSATKFLCGPRHGGRRPAGRQRRAFDWAVRPLPELTEPYDGFHGMVFSEEAPSAPSCCAPGARACATSAPA
jgi:O-acetylhomoserine (thiol)-lyase